jgi:putative flippase GtrA
LSGWRVQGARFIIVGLASNLLLYLFYLLVTGLGLGYKIAMTLAYVLSAAQTFAFNAFWTFEHRRIKGPLVRYVIAYVVCYFVNISALIVFVDRVGMPHQVVQGVMILVIAAVMFLLQKFWVFASPRAA